MSESGIRFIDPPEPNERLLAYELSGDFTGDDMRTFVERLEKIANSGQKALLYQDMVDRGSFDFETIKVKIKNLGTIWRSVEKIGGGGRVEVAGGLHRPRGSPHTPTGEVLRQLCEGRSLRLVDELSLFDTR
jgi:hypothetical protein